MLQKTSTNNRQVQRTRSWIFEALMLLMDEKPYNKITVSDITEKAGVARQTFYRNYDEKDDVIFEYLKNTFNTSMLKVENSSEKDKQDNIILSFNYNYITGHRDTLKKILSNVDIENRIFPHVQELPLSFIVQYKDKLSSEEYLICRYKICYQITGCLRVFLDWFKNDMPMPIEKMITMINAMSIPKQIQYRNIPNIVVCINNK